MSYQSYPTGGAAEPEPQRPAPPTPVLQAVKLMYAGAIVTAIGLIISLVTIGSLKATLHSAHPGWSASKLHSDEVALLVFGIVLALITIGLWLWMAYANKAGKNWARITATVFFALDTLSALSTFRQAEPVLSRLISILVWLIGLGAIVLLYQRQSSAYFSASKTRR